MSRCKEEPVPVAPVIDRNRCDGKADCVDVCPYDVFELGILSPEHRIGLNLMTHLKGTLNGWKQSFPVNAEACRACGLCVTTCPEKAIRLAPY